MVWADCVLEGLLEAGVGLGVGRVMEDGLNEKQRRW